MTLRTLIILISILVFNQNYSQSKNKDLKLTIAGLPLFGSSQDFSSGINGFVLKPTIGYYISDKTSIDLNFTYANLEDLKVGNVDSYYNSYAIVPSIRNNFINSKKIRVFAELGFGFGTIKYEADNSNFRNADHSNISGGISIFNIGLGGNYYFTDDFGIELIIPYISSKNITSNRNNTIYSGVGPTLGLTYLLN